MCRRSQSSGPSIPQFAHVHNRRGDAVTVHSRAFFARFVPLMCVDETLVLLALATGRFRGSAGSKSRVSARARSPKISLLPIAGGGDMRPEQGEEAAATQSPKNKRQYSACAERGNHRHMVTISITVDTSRAWCGARPATRKRNRNRAGKSRSLRYYTSESCLGVEYAFTRTA
jgi:hypothetical protein